MKIPALGPTTTASSTVGSTYLLAQHGAPLWLIATITILGIGVTFIAITGSFVIEAIRSTWPTNSSDRRKLAQTIITVITRPKSPTDNPPAGVPPD